MKITQEQLNRLVSLAKREHHSNGDDPWYSCPKDSEGCANESDGDDCNCGADEHNSKVESLYLKIINGVRKVKKMAIVFLDDNAHYYIILMNDEIATIQRTEKSLMSATDRPLQSYEQTICRLCEYILEEIDNVKDVEKS